MQMQPIHGVQDRGDRGAGAKKEMGGAPAITAAKSGHTLPAEGACNRTLGRPIGRCADHRLKRKFSGEKKPVDMPSWGSILLPEEPDVAHCPFQSSRPEGRTDIDVPSVPEVH
jgi:hypothetical protein